MLVFACFSPHPPIILPTVGSHEDREKVKSTITALESLAPELAEAKPEIIIISSPHPDWGIEVPLFFLTAKLPNKNIEIKTFLTTMQTPTEHFKKGRKVIKDLPRDSRVAWIASGDMSHVLKEDGPYGFHPSGPKFDQKFIALLKKKEVKSILALDPELVEEAGVCGLWSFCMLLGALDWQSSLAGLKPRLAWQPEILSYEGPFGVGYLVCNFKLYG